MNNEIWKPVVGYSGYYSVSSLGSVRSENRTTSDGKACKRKILKPSYSRGYTHVVLSMGGSTLTRRVHRIVAEAFYGISDMQVDHINSVKDDNRIENLEYVTCRENITRSRSPLKKNSLPTGVQKRCKKFRASAWRDGKNHYLGTFETPEAAKESYDNFTNSYCAFRGSNKIA